MFASIVLIFAAVIAPVQGAAPASQSEIQFARGLELQRRGDLQGAREAYEAALRLTPRRIEALSNLGVVNAHLGRYELAIKYYQEALEIDPSHNGIRLNLGIAYFQIQEFELARRELARVVTVQPGNHQARLLLGLCLLQLGTTREAITELEAVYRAQPENIAAAYALASAYISDNQLEKGGELVDKIFKHLDSAETHLIMGSLNLAAKDYEKAVDELKQAKQLNPRLPTAHSQLGTAYLFGGKRDLAIREFQEELKANPKDFSANLRLGWLYREDGKLDAAATLLKRALDLRPNDTGALFQMAQLAQAEGSVGEAVNLLERVVMQAPDFTPAQMLLAHLYFKLKRAGAAWGMLGLCDYQLGRYDDALDHMRKSRRLGVEGDPELSRMLRYHEGTLLLLKGEFEAAQLTLGALGHEGLKTEDLIIALGLSVLRISALPKQIDANQRDRALVRRAGWAEYQSAQRKVGEAQQEYERLVADFPTTPNVQYAYGRFLLALRDNEKAITAFEREIANSPNHAMARFQIAYIKMSNKDAAGALEFANQGVKLNPGLGFGHYILGRLLFETGQNGRAIEELEAARRLSPDESRIYYALWRVYARANRQADAEQARENFEHLSQLDGGAAGTNPGKAPWENLSEGPAPPRND